MILLNSRTPKNFLIAEPIGASSGPSTILILIAQVLKIVVQLRLD